jgi:GT2 family glycosyltransferase
MTPTSPVKRPTPKVVIIVLNWNGKKDTLACLESLEKLTYSNFETIVVDNGSTDASSTAIREKFPHCNLLETGANLGFAEGNNVGIRKAIERQADYLFLLNNDTVVASDILEGFIETFRSHPTAGVLGAKIFLFEQQDTLDHLGGLWNKATGTFEFIGLHKKEDSISWQEPEKLDYVCGAGLMIKREVVEAIGGLEPRFFLIWEESDFCFRARRAGFQILTCPQAKLWHRVSSSFIGGKPHSTYFWWRNRLLWIERNCPFKEKLKLYLRVLLPDILHMLKIHGIKKIQLFALKKLRPKADVKEKEMKILKNRAALCGVRDYFLRRFGKGPDWITTSSDAPVSSGVSEEN